MWTIKSLTRLPSRFDSFGVFFCLEWGAKNRCHEAVDGSTFCVESTGVRLFSFANGHVQILHCLAWTKSMPYPGHDSPWLPCCVLRREVDGV